MAAAVLGPIGDVASRQVEKFQSNPWDYIANLLIEIGSLLLLLGVALGFVGYYLKAYSVKAKGDAAQGIATVESVFGNVSFNASQQPYLAVNGPNVANDVVNLGNDAWRFLANTGGQAWADLKGIATAVDDIPKALVQLVSQGPGIAINGFLGLVSEALSDIFILIFPYAIIFGAGMLAAGAGMIGARYVWDAYLKPEWGVWVDAHVGAPIQSWTHRLLGNPSPPAAWPGEGAPAASPPPVAPPPAVLSAPVAPEPVPAPPDAPAAVSANPILGSTAETPPAPPPETMAAVPSDRQEEQLGDALTTAKDHLRAALRRKRDAPAPQEDYIGWAYSRIPAAA
ncbi:MAG: hypothetical protein L3K19_09440 [Thermoplasmata archaeon]|nr:hypothetical protein [Thermoplasmata archaeon]